MRFNITPIPIFEDNYTWILTHSGEKRGVIVDPGDGERIGFYLNHHQMELEEIWLTHHHRDHQGGVLLLKEIFPHCKVRSPFAGSSRYPGSDLSLESPFFWHEIEVIPILTPGHTLDHTCLYLPAIQALFCGDTLFSAGCGRLFEGTAEQMQNSLTRLSSLPEETQVYCAHEYTEKNIRFALQWDPKNQDLSEYAQWVSKQREKNSPTLPSSIGLEKKINPFLRVLNPDFISLFPGQSPLEVFSHLRNLRNSF